LIALAIRLDSPGAVFYSQTRVGQGGRIFTVRKLRTMVTDAERDGQAVWAARNDPRVTRAGTILRRLHLDEVPQFWNVLRGEMSIVGPRPERPEFVAQLEKHIPFYRLRHAVKPGIAGWAITHADYVGSVEDARLRVEYDLYYIKHQSLWLDFWILFRTVWHVLAFKGR
jgi:lipopolysaccharide/colanic/teichoic acid biosynthesis glycosyltransferase